MTASVEKLSEAQRRILTRAVESADPDGCPVAGRSVAAVQCLKEAGLVKAMIGADYDRLHIRVWATDAGRRALQGGDNAE